MTELHVREERSLVRCVVRITDPQGETRGTGFLVSADGLIVTCAHVVRGTEPCVAFPGGKPRSAHVMATDDTHDVVILRVEGELPSGTAPARLSRSTEAHYCDFRSQGYRPMEGLEGIPAEGRVLDAVSEAPGYPGVCYMPLILQTQHAREGMSGSPVYVPDLDLVVGMITDRWDSLIAKTGFSDRDTALATPSEAIAAVCSPSLALHSSPLTSRPSPFQAPAVPRYFVSRPEVTDDLKALLMAEEAAALGALVVSAVHGLGGIGKTTLVAALAHDAKIQSRFPDGVLWATLGQQPHVLSLLAGWIQALGDYGFHSTVIESASAHLRTLLHDMVCLLVVDDAWQADNVRAFLVGGPRCRVLVTTRDATLARKVGAHLYDLDVMTEAQALALFEARLGPLDGNHAQAAALARELGYLPLAIELSAAQVEAGIPWTELLDAFRRELADLAALDLDEATYRNESLRLSFRLSLEQLSLEDQEAFAWLGVLPEDAHLNAAIAATLWDQLEAEARNHLRRLRDRALLKSVGDDLYAVHDLLHDEAKLRLVDWMPMAEGQAAFLDRYRRKVPDERWDRLPDDGYIHQHLTWHMEQAGQPEAIHALLRLETAEGHNAWYQARESKGQTAGYLADVSRAWQRAEMAEDVKMQVRYALCHSSVVALSANVPTVLLARGIERGLLSSEQALALARSKPEQWERARALNALVPLLASRESVLLAEVLAVAGRIANDFWRAEVLTGLAPHLPNGLLEKAMVAAREIEDRYCRVQVLMSLAPRLPEPLRERALEETLAVARQIGNKEERARALADLVLHLPLTEEALAAVWEITDAHCRAEILACLAPRLPEPLRKQALEKLLATAWEIEDRWRRTDVLGSLAPYLSQELLDMVFMATRGIGDERARAQALAVLSTHLPEQLKDQALREALAATREIEYADGRVRMLASLSTYLTGRLQVEVLREALTAAREVEDKRSRAEVLAGLLMHLVEPLREEALREALAAAREVEDKQWRAEMLANLSLHLSEPLGDKVLKEAMAVAREIGDGLWRAKTLTGLIPYLPEELLGKALIMVLETEDADEQVLVLNSLSPHVLEQLAVEEAEEVLEIVRKIRNRQARLKALITLSSSFSEQLRERVLKEALMTAQEIGYAGERARILIKLAPLLPERLIQQALSEALVAAREIGYADERARVLNELASHLPEQSKQQVLSEALMAAREAGYVGDQARLLVDLAPRLPRSLKGQVLAEALTAVRQVKYARDRARVLIELIPRLPKHLRGQVLSEALAVVREIRDIDGREQVLAGLVPCLPELLLGEVSGEALAATQNIKDARVRAGMLTGLAPHLPEELLGDALAAAQKTRGGRRRAETLVGLAPYLPERLLRKAIATARQIGSRGWRAKALMGLAVHLQEPLRKEELGEALAAVCQTKDEGWRVEVLAALVPHLPNEMLQEALAIARGFQGGRMRARALANLAPYFSESLRRDVLKEAIAAAQEIGSERTRVKALTGLAPCLPKELLGKALAIAQGIGKEEKRARALVSLAPYLSERLLGEALTAVREIKEDDRARVLVALAPNLPEGLLGEALTTAQEVEDREWRTKMLASLAPHLTAVSRPVLAHILLEDHDATNLLRALACRPREHLLSDLCALAPLIHKLGSEEAIAETFRAIQDVGRWWP